MIIINGKSFSYSGSGDISISNGKITINGKNIEIEDSKNIIIEIVGNVNRLDIDQCNKININGDVGDIKTTSGNVTSKNVTGDIKTMSGNVECGDITGDVQTMSGDVKAQLIHGSTKTVSGDIKTK